MRCGASAAAPARGLSAVARGASASSAVEPVDVEKIAYPVNMHRSDAAARVVKVPVIEVTTGHVAMCNGGGGKSRGDGVKQNQTAVANCGAAGSREACGSHAALPLPSLAGATGHPIEFLQLDRRAGAEPSLCRYCGLRYVAAGHGHHH